MPMIHETTPGPRVLTPPSTAGRPYSRPGPLPPFPAGGDPRACRTLAMLLTAVETTVASFSAEIQAAGAARNITTTSLNARYSALEAEIARLSADEEAALLGGNQAGYVAAHAALPGARVHLAQLAQDLARAELNYADVVAGITRQRQVALQVYEGYLDALWADARELLDMQVRAVQDAFRTAHLSLSATTQNFNAAHQRLDAADAALRAMLTHARQG